MLHVRARQGGVMSDDESLKNNSNGDKTVDKSAPSVDNSKAKQGSIDGVNKSTGKKRGRGGARPGAGRPKGKMEAKTIEKMHVKKAFEDRVAKNAHRLFNAQVTLALGTQYLFKRQKVKSGKRWRWTPFERVTDPEEMLAFLDGDFSKDADKVYYMITADKPDSKAIDSLLDRGFGKAPQNLNIKDDRPDPIATILKKFGLLEDEGDSSAGQTEGTS